MRSFIAEALRLKFVTDAIYGDHLRGLGHIESPDRVEVVASRLQASGVLREILLARDAGDDELLRAHDAGYIELLRREVQSPPHELSTGDVFVDARSFDVARRAAGGVLVALDATARLHEPVFALVRPPGHHATAARGMGFCLFNNAIVAARGFVAETGGRALIVDFDYHHGNGTEALAGDGVSYVSTHAYPAYPGTGRRSYLLPGGDAVLNVPLPASGISTEAFVAIWRWLLPYAAAQLRPDILIVSAGFDYAKGDPVGDLGVEVAAAGELASIVSATAAEQTKGRVAYLLEGGYSVDALVESIALVARQSDRPATSPLGTADDAAIPAPISGIFKEIVSCFQGTSQGASN